MAEARDTDLESMTSDAGGAVLERKLTNTENNAIQHPGDVRINVKGAFIVDQSEEVSLSPVSSVEDDGYQHDGKDIRLPNHQSVVSHIAVDVCASFP